MRKNTRLPLIPRQTYLEAARGNALEYCGAFSDDENLAWLAELFLHHLCSLSELDAVHSSFPWRSIVCLSGSAQETLAAMCAEWQFVTEIVDVLPPKHSLHTLLSITKTQPYRDLMTKAEILISIGNKSIVHCCGCKV